MATRVSCGTVLISIALAFGSATADAASCLDSPIHDALQIASHHKPGDCIACERPGRVLTAPDQQPSAMDSRAAPASAESHPVSLGAPPAPASPGAWDAPSAPSHGPLAYSILEKTDDHVLGGVRVVVKIQLSREASESELRTIGDDIICQETASRRLSAIQLLYYLAEADTSGLSVAGTAVWAPSGHWGAAHTVRLGDYSRHQHVVSVGHVERAWESPTAVQLRGMTR
jgi:hypothetical protein